MIELLNTIESYVSVGALGYVELAVVVLVILLTAGAAHRSNYSTSYFDS